LDFIDLMGAMQRALRRNDFGPPPERFRASRRRSEHASRLLTTGLHDQVADAAELDGLVAIESLTNSRVCRELGRPSLMSPGDRVAGPGAALKMAAFKSRGMSNARNAGHIGMLCDGHFEMQPTYFVVKKYCM